jgi:hypothetical protein
MKSVKKFTTFNDLKSSETKTINVAQSLKKHKDFEKSIKEIKSKTTKLMTTTPEHDQKFAKLIFASVYPMYVKKVETKGRTEAELKQVIEWLTGFNNKKLQQLIKDKVTFEEFFKQAAINPNAHLITGMICGYRIEDITTPLTKQARYLDKLVDELAKGRKMEKILRAP